MGIMDEQRLLLDQLFGLNRNSPLLNSNNSTSSFSDKDVCKYYLCGLCPYFELFKNTKSDLGPCQYRLHEERFRDEYSNLPESSKRSYGYETDLLFKLRNMVREMDRKIVKSKQRAEEENAPKPLNAEHRRLLDDMTERSNQQMEMSQKFGECGEIEKSLNSAHEADKIKSEKVSLEQRLKYPSGRIMFVCEICGVFINSTDNEAR